MLDFMRREKWFKILECLINSYMKEWTLKELADASGTSKSFVKQVVDELEKEMIVTSKNKANLRLVKLVDSRKVTLFKSWYFSELLLELGIEGIANNYISLALFGSHARGNYDEKSDIDILLVGPVHKDEINMKVVNRIEKETKKSMDIKIISLEEWERNKLKDSFMRNILANHVLLAGEEL